MLKQFTLAQLADVLAATYQGDASHQVVGIAPIESASQDQLAFLDNPKYKKHLETTKAGVVILSQELAQFCQSNALIVDNPYFAYATVAKLFQREKQFSTGAHPTAVIGQGCTISETASIGPHVVVIGENAVVEAGCVVGDLCRLGDQVHLYPRVTLYDGTHVGARSIIHAGAVLGSDGFGFAKHQGQWKKVPQLGHVIIGEDVEIGANTTIDCGALGDTVIHNDVKLDNQVQIAHNVEIGEHTAVAGCTGIAGSAKIGRDCLIGGAVGIGGHLSVCDNVAITAQSGVSKSIKEPGVYSSTLPVQKDKKWKRTLARLNQLDKTHERLKQCEFAVGELLMREKAESEK